MYVTTPGRFLCLRGLGRNKCLIHRMEVITTESGQGVVSSTFHIRPHSLCLFDLSALNRHQPEGLAGGHFNSLSWKGSEAMSFLGGSLGVTWGTEVSHRLGSTGTGIPISQNAGGREKTKSVHSAHQDGLVPPIATRVKAKTEGWAMECMSQDPHWLELQLGDETRCPASLALFSDPSAHTSVEQGMSWGRQVIACSFPSMKGLVGPCG